VADDIPIPEQAKGGPIFDVVQQQNDLKFVPVPEPRSVLFPCPSCQATISTTVQCPFCSASIDPRTIEPAAELMSRLNQARSEAGYLKILAGLMVLFLAVVSVVGVPRRAAFGQWFLLIAVPVMAIRWWVRFGAVRSDDPDFRRARRAIMTAVAIWIPFFLLFGIPAILALVPGRIPR
jgi:hypothetical protein